MQESVELEEDEYIISLYDNYCIQCNSEVDLLSANFTLYQAEGGQHYLYCEQCKSPYEPIKKPEIIIREVPSSFNYLAFISFIVGAAIGWWL